MTNTVTLRRMVPATVLVAFCVAWPLAEAAHEARGAAPTVVASAGVSATAKPSCGLCWR
jgi:hypothetical protein